MRPLPLRTCQHPQHSGALLFHLMPIFCLAFQMRDSAYLAHFPNFSKSILVHLQGFAQEINNALVVISLVGQMLIINYPIIY